MGEDGQPYICLRMLWRSLSVHWEIRELKGVMVNYLKESLPSCRCTSNPLDSHGSILNLIVKKLCS